MKKTYPSILSSTRRDFLKKSAMAGVFSIVPSYVVLGKKSKGKELPPSEKVNLACVGIANRGAQNIQGVTRTGLANYVAFCDIDLQGNHVKKALEKHPQVNKQYSDWRKMFDEMSKDIDAVLISTPDHAHFSLAMQAMSLGKHVYVEKPLAHTFGQCERLMKMADKSGVVTQMGNQGHSGANYFQFKLWSEKEVIRDVHKITAYMNKGRRWHPWNNITAYPEETLPQGIDWDLWMDSAPVHPFSEKLHPGNWRGWYDYGSGAFGDWGPHILDTCHRFLKLGYPTKVSAAKRDRPSDLIFPLASTIKFDFAARDSMPACSITWYDGKENLPLVAEELGNVDPDSGELKPVNLKAPGKILYGKGPDGKDIVFQGGSHAKPLRIIPDKRYRDLAPNLPKIKGKQSDHYANFLLACKGEEEARSPFSVSAPLTQVFNLGVLAQRFGGEIEFDSSSKKITNNTEANALMDPAPRKGWEQYYKV